MMLLNRYCVKSGQIRSYFWSVFSRIQIEYGETRSISRFSPNAGKYGPEITPYLDTFRAVRVIPRIGIKIILQVLPNNESLKVLVE